MITYYYSEIACIFRVRILPWSCMIPLPIDSELTQAIYYVDYLNSNNEKDRAYGKILKLENDFIKQNSNYIEINKIANYFYKNYDNKELNEKLEKINNSKRLDWLCCDYKKLEEKSYGFVNFNKLSQKDITNYKESQEILNLDSKKSEITTFKENLTNAIKTIEVTEIIANSNFIENDNNDFENKTDSK